MLITSRSEVEAPPRPGFWFRAVREARGGDDVYLTDETINIDISQMQHVKQQCHTIELLQTIETIHTGIPSHGLATRPKRMPPS